jgi:hypothetical protein
MADGGSRSGSGSHGCCFSNRGLSSLANPRLIQNGNQPWLPALARHPRGAMVQLIHWLIEPLIQGAKGEMDQ